MKFITTFIILVSICWQCLATEQVYDVWIEDGKHAEVFTTWAYKSPLEHYFFETNTKSPFEMENTANYRGHVAYWEMIDKKLFLKKITVDAEGEEIVRNHLGRISEKREPFDMSKVFKTGITEHGRFADWFSGSILVFLEPYKSGEYSVEYKEFRVVLIKDGIRQDQHSFTPDDYYKAVREVNDGNNKAELSPNAVIVKKHLESQKTEK